MSVLIFIFLVNSEDWRQCACDYAEPKLEMPERERLVPTQAPNRNWAPHVIDLEDTNRFCLRSHSLVASAGFSTSALSFRSLCNSIAQSNAAAAPPHIRFVHSGSTQIHFTNVIVPLNAVTAGWMRDFQFVWFHVFVFLSIGTATFFGSDHHTQTTRLLAIFWHWIQQDARNFPPPPSVVDFKQVENKSQQINKKHRRMRTQPWACAWYEYDIDVVSMALERLSNSSHDLLWNILAAQRSLWWIRAQNDVGSWFGRIMSSQLVNHFAFDWPTRDICWPWLCARVDAIGGAGVFYKFLSLNFIFFVRQANSSRKRRVNVYNRINHPIYLNWRPLANLWTWSWFTVHGSRGHSAAHSSLPLRRRCKRNKVSSSWRREPIASRTVSMIID